MRQREINKIGFKSKKVLIKIDVRDFYKIVDTYVTKWITLIKKDN